MVPDPKPRAGEACAACPSLCRGACPTASAAGTETFAPRNLMMRAGAMRANAASAVELGSLPWACTDCGACTDACAWDVDVAGEQLRARSRVAATGHAPAGAVELAAGFGIAGTPEGTSLAPALETMLRDARTSAARRPSWLFLPGCETTQRAPEAGAAVLRLAGALGLGGLRAGPASSACCGLGLAWAGEMEGFAAHAARFAAEPSVRSAERLVVQDTRCADAFRRLYPEVGVSLDAQVFTVQEVIAAAARSAPWRGEASTVRVLEGCRALGHSARLAVELSGASVEAGELGCCGGAGLLERTYPEEARAMARRWSEPTPLVVASPRCLAHLRAAGVEAEDWAGWLEQRL